MRHRHHLVAGVYSRHGATHCRLYRERSLQGENMNASFIAEALLRAAIQHAADARLPLWGVIVSEALALPGNVRVWDHALNSS